jgi:hypothetical protein
MIRKSVPTAGMSKYWEVGWMYVMPDFDNRDHSIIEWSSDKAPVEPDHVPHPLTGGENERAGA